MRNFKVGSGERVAQDGWSLALKVGWPCGASQLLVVFASPTRDKLTHTKHAQTLQFKKGVGRCFSVPDFSKRPP